MKSADAPTLSRKPPLEGRRILVVDDHAHTAILVKQTLLSAGAAEVAVANDGEMALAMLPSFRPDLIVTDMMMPVIGGMELVRVVRQAALTPNAGVPDPTVPIVLVSAFGSRRAVRAARQAGIDAFVVKPFSVGSLVKRVDRAGNRTADFVVRADYVGPDRRTSEKRKGPAHRALDMEPVALIPIADDTLASHPLRVVTQEDVAGEGGPSMLQALYDRIRDLEEERAAERA
ncbi:MAG: response regulator receiver protein [Caulobacter sp.]|nr:response regulator receiver protein [Caulobacter sp.]